MSTLRATVLLTAFILTPVLVTAAQVGRAAPPFTARDAHGAVHQLADYHGKWVVLEWYDPECPYTHKQYDSGNMQRLQKKWTAKGVVWLTVYTASNPSDTEKSVAEHQNAAATTVLLDSTAAVARAYEAKTALHMFIVDPKGTLVYNGAIDDRPTTDVADVAGAHNFVDTGLSEAMAGRPISTPTSRPYGCAVQYPGGQ